MTSISRLGTTFQKTYKKIEIVIMFLTGYHSETYKQYVDIWLNMYNI